MKCPNCGLINPDTAMWCDCGYDFQARAQRKRPELNQTVKRESAPDRRVLTIPSVLTYLMFILVLLCFWFSAWDEWQCINVATAHCQPWGSGWALILIPLASIVFVVALLLTLILVLRREADKPLAILASSPIVFVILAGIASLIPSAVHDAIVQATPWVHVFVSWLLYFLFAAYTALAVFAFAWRAWEAIAANRKQATQSG